MTLSLQKRTHLGDAGAQLPSPQKGHQAESYRENDCAAGIQKHIPDGRAASWRDALVQFVQAGDGRGGGDRAEHGMEPEHATGRCPDRPAAMQQKREPAAGEENAQQTVSTEVTRLAEDVVRLSDIFNLRLEMQVEHERLQPLAGVARAHDPGGLRADDCQTEEDRNPCHPGLLLS